MATEAPAEEAAAAANTPTPGHQRPALEAAKLGEDITGKVFIVTGAYTGIGVETAKALLAQGGKVVIGGRNEEQLEEFTAQMKKDYSEGQVDGHQIDLGDLESVQAFAKYVLANEEYKDVCVICNAGVMNTPKGSMSKSGFDMQMGVNVVGHYLLCKMLANITVRQVWVSSLGHKMNESPRIDFDKIKQYQSNNFDGYSGWAAYQQSKLGNILLAKEFGKRYPAMVTASLHPGGINTKLNRHTGAWGFMTFMTTHVWQLMRENTGHMGYKTPEAGAATTVTCATLPKDKLVNGGYYEDCDVTGESESAKNEEDAAALFDYCEQVTHDFQK